MVVDGRRGGAAESVEVDEGSLGRTVGVGGFADMGEDPDGGKVDDNCADCCSWTREVNGIAGDGSGFFHGEAPGVEIFGDGKPSDGRP